MKFIADAMLGRLAKWLRILGYDVLYHPSIQDRQIIKLARGQNRTVLTRDTRLIKSRGLRDYIFISSDDVFDQLREIRKKLDVAEVPPFMRCPACNGLLSDITRKKEIREYVPEFIYHNFNNFLKCGDCAKVYWKGTHHSRIREKLSEVFSDADSGRSAERDM